MRRRHHAAAHVERRADNTICSDPLEREHDADDVENGVEGADLVEMHLLDGHLMNRRFGFGEPLEQSLGAIATCG